MHQLKNKCRALWHQACELHQIGGESHHRLLSWCVQFAGQLVTRTRKGTDGMTSWSIVTGRREFPRKLVPWGERVLYIAGGSKFKPGVQAKLQDGIFLRLADHSNECTIGTIEGCVKTSNLSRVPREDARDPNLFDQAQGSPWKLPPTAESGLAQEELPTRLAVRPLVKSYRGRSVVRPKQDPGSCKSDVMWNWRSTERRTHVLSVWLPLSEARQWYTQKPADNVSSRRWQRMLPVASVLKLIVNGEET